MMEPMDEFFRKKMDGRDLPFNEAHWVAAQQLLDDRDARRGAIWWWRSGLLAIALAVVVVALWPSTSKPGSTASATLSEKPVAEKKAVERSLSTDVSAEPDQAAGLEKLVDSAEAAAAGDKKEPVLSAASTGSVKPPQIAQPANSAPKPVERSVQAEAFKLENDIFKTLISPGKAPAAESTAPPVAMESQEEQQPERQMVAVFDPMPVLSFAVEGGSRRDVGELPDPCWPVRKRWSVQTILGGSLPAQGNQAGALLGLGASWPGRDGFGLYAEGLYRIRPLSGLPTQASLQRTYGFGLTENAFELRANSLHYVDVNAGATYALGRHQLHAGAGATYLFGARGQLEQAQKPEAELDYGPVSAISEGWIATEGLSQWLFRAQAGYTFEIFPNLQLAGRVQYSITPILTEMAPEQPRLSPVSFDLMLKYKLW
ncbi:hypothetical protein [Phaeodactylibacter xiamenensis]|uniref:hypothetical protein n=1 Tax=Phaeodactylibacter xiamenensis TaxID=1524460 RepID=UPI003BAD97EB